MLVADRERRGRQSFLAKTLIDRARDLAEALKVHRIPSPDHVVIGLLLEPLQNRQCNLDSPPLRSDYLLTLFTENPEDPNGILSNAASSLFT